MRHLAIVCLLAAACGTDKAKNTDANAAGLDCTTYCNAITANCTGSANLQYGAMDQCLASCSHFSSGSLGDVTGNTLGCRIYHANAAQTAPNTHCVHAGPSGGSVCGMPCEGFCSLVTAECAAVYPSANGCSTTCATFATTPSYTANVTSGNSLSCRIYHATAASTDPATHCPHTGSNSTPCS